MTLNPIQSVAVVAPAGVASDGRIERGLDALRAYDVDVTIVPIGEPPRHYLAGNDAYRAAAMQRAWAMDVDAIWALRGGFGCVRTLAALGSYTDSKPLFGFSDITTLLVHAPVAWHAPVITQLPNLDIRSRDALRDVLTGRYRSIPLDSERTIIKPGAAVGKLIAGNLTVLSSLCGTPWQANLDGCILCLEDVGEPPYRVDRSWTQLRLSGALDGLRGLVIGRFTGVVPGEQETLSMLFEEMAQDVDGPVVRGLSIGHLAENIPIPIGRLAELRDDSGYLQIRWG